MLVLWYFYLGDLTGVLPVLRYYYLVDLLSVLNFLSIVRHLSERFPRYIEWMRRRIRKCKILGDKNEARKKNGRHSCPRPEQDLGLGLDVPASLGLGLA